MSLICRRLERALSAMATSLCKTLMVTEEKAIGRVRTNGRLAAPPSCPTVQDLQPASPTVRVLFDMFHRASDLDLFISCVTPVTGALLEFTIRPESRRPRICELVQSTPEGLRRCQSSCRSMTEQILKNPRMTRQRCHAGLISFHSATMLHGVYPADVHTGCVPDRDHATEQMKSFAKVAAELRLPPKRTREALLSLKDVKPLRTQNIRNWLDFISNYLSATLDPPRVKAEREFESDSDCEPSTAPRPGVPLDGWIRREISCLVPLPPQNANRSSGCSETLIHIVADLLCQHVELSFTTERVAEALGFETSYFCKMFKRYTHESMFKVLQRKRLHLARQLLENPFLSVQEVSNRVGFSDASYFTRVFRRSFGSTPLEYRERKM